MKRIKSDFPGLLSTGMLSILLAVADTARSQSPDYTFVPVAKTADGQFTYFEPAVINNRGDVLFGPGLSTGGEGVFLWRNGQTISIAAAGQTLPGGGTVGFTLSPLAMSDSGEVAFSVTRDGPNSLPMPPGLNAGVYRYGSRRRITPVMVPGVTLVPGSSGPGGSVFRGSHFITAINNGGDIVFPGMICSDAPSTVQTVSCPDGSSSLLTFGVYRVDQNGTISAVVKPGDPAPGSNRQFDLAHGPAVNGRGDVAFTAHIFGESCLATGGSPCADSLYVKRSANGKIESIAHHGDPSPVPGKTYFSAFGAILDAVGDVAFLGDLSENGDGSNVAVFLYSNGTTVTIARHGDVMPGGGTLATAGFFNHDVDMNNQGEIVFVGTLEDGAQGLYLWRRGNLSLVAKTGTTTGAGTIANLDDFGSGRASTQVGLNDVGQIIFAATFQGGGGALLRATRR